MLPFEGGGPNVEVDPCVVVLINGRSKEFRLHHNIADEEFQLYLIAVYFDLIWIQFRRTLTLSY